MSETPKKIEKLLGLINEEIASPQDVLDAVQLMVDLMGKTDSKLSQRLESISAKLEKEIGELSDSTDSMIADHKSLIDEVRSTLELSVKDIKKELHKQIESVRSEIPVVDYSDLETKINGIRIPTIEEIENDLPKLGNRIRDGLELLSGDERLERSAIKGLDDYEEVSRLAREPKSSQFTAITGVKELVAGSGITIDNSNYAYPVISSNGVSSDEKVKYDAADPTAGYVSEKFVAGTGISIAEGTGANENKLQITNSSPDQTVVLTSGTGISAAGTYPNFTITNTAPDQTVSLTAGAGISTSGTYPNFTITNSAPDQVVSITGSGAATVTGTYPNFNVDVTAGGTGDVIGPASATDNAIARFDSTTGKLIQNSGITIGDNNDMAGANSFTFLTAPTSLPSTEGTMYWDAADHAPSVLTDVSGVVLQMGQEMYVRARNSTGATIANGSVVYVSGSTGQRPNITKAQANAAATASSTIGVATHDIANNTDGFVTTFGLVRDLDTSSFLDGDTLYLSATVAGGLTNTKPASPNLVVEIGRVIKSHITQGVILVDIKHNSLASDVTTSVTNFNRILSSSDTDVQKALDTLDNSAIGASTTDTLSNKSISLGSNTITGTIAQFNTALSDADFATLAGAETLTNKNINLTSNTLVATSAQLAAAVTDETGSGSLVFATSPTLVTPTLGVASATSINKVAITAPATSATLTIADGKTLTASNTLTFTGTDASSVAFGTGGTVAYTSNNLGAFASTTSAQLAGVISDETGSGALVFATSPTLTTPRFADLGYIADANGNELLILDTVTSAVNEITLANAATGNNPTLTASGGDSNVGLNINLKGTGTFNIRGSATQAGTLRLYEDTDNGTNYTGFKVGTQSADIDYVLPTAQGGASTVLTNDGSGNLSWAAAGGGSTTPVVRINSFLETSTRLAINQTISGGTLSMDSYGADISTSSTASSGKKLGHRIIPAGSGDIRSGNPIASISFGLPVAGTDFDIFLGLHNVTVAGSGITFTDEHAGFKITRTASGTINLYATQADGTTETASASLTTLTAGDTLELIIKVNTGVSIDYYWRKNGGAMSSATNLTANMPSATALPYIEAGVTNKGAASNTVIYWGSFSYER